MVKLIFKRGIWAGKQIELDSPILPKSIDIKGTIYDFVRTGTKLKFKLRPTRTLYVADNCDDEGEWVSYRPKILPPRKRKPNRKK